MNSLIEQFEYRIPRQVKMLWSASNQHFHIHFLFLLFAALYKMVCTDNETNLDIHIPAIMLPIDAGTRLEKMLMSSSSGELSFIIFNQYYSSYVAFQ